MLELYKQLIADQFEAALCMHSAAIDECPHARWHEPVAQWRFSQAAFHALFFTDVYLGRELAELREQAFHREHVDQFGDYEELERRPPQALYDKTFVGAYLQHCRDKAQRTVASETAESLARRPGFDWLKFSRAEVHVYNLRHIQHHAAQLGLVLRNETGTGVDWVGSGWGEGWRA